ncbi:hypothetical protein SAMN05443633_102162 [Chryseobacterium arachidis]|uniref:Uncharacterized protein n=1 Tax=Chryseobacterium arachidis TaxID=1416778 RepID=A0A1M4WWX5_9FLAO|nr:hypothetical protein [Chryseobacterium arachidis]SHE85739.1 hypothetical protein SAMN05443633_102162 [Chryseobacterium arachidis]
MRFYLFSLFLLTQSFVFGQNISKEDSVQIRKETKISQWLEERLRYNREQCHNDSLRAVTDSKLENKYYMNIAAPHGRSFIPSEELKIILQKHNITWGGEWMGSDLGAYASSSCYYQFMTQFTVEKFGKEFIDNLVKQSVSDYVKKHPDKIFNNDEHTDWNYKETYGDSHEKDLLNKDFSESFVYPKDYNYTKNEYDSQTIVTLNLDNKGKVLRIVRFNHHISNENNLKYIPYFEEEIKKFIKTCKFEPLKYKGYPVRSKIALRFFYK